MLSYDGRDSCLSRKIYSLFGGVDEDKELWLNDFSCVVSCMVVVVRKEVTYAVMHMHRFIVPLAHSFISQLTLYKISP